MSQQYFKKSTAVIFCALLAACGGGSSEGDTPAQTGTSTGSTGSGTTNPSTGTPIGGAPTFPSGTATGNSPSAASGSGTSTTPSSGSGTTPSTSTGSGSAVTPPSSGTGSDTIPPSADSGSSTSPSEPAAPAFTAQLVAAPPSTSLTGRFLGEQGENGVITYADTVYFEVSGTGLRNVELVSANNTSIKYGIFTISADGTRATLNWDYQLGDASGAYAAYDLRILAWNVPAGQAGDSIEVMAPRRYGRRVSPGMCGVSGCVVAP